MKEAVARHRFSMHRTPNRAAFTLGVSRWHMSELEREAPEEPHAVPLRPLLVPAESEALLLRISLRTGRALD